MLPENMQLSETETLLVGITIILLLVALIILKVKSNKPNL
jgi:hypothetical protein